MNLEEDEEDLLWVQERDIWCVRERKRERESWTKDSMF